MRAWVVFDVDGVVVVGAKKSVYEGFPCVVALVNVSLKIVEEYSDKFVLFEAGVRVLFAPSHVPS